MNDKDVADIFFTVHANDVQDAAKQVPKINEEHPAIHGFCAYEVLSSERPRSWFARLFGMCRVFDIVVRYRAYSRCKGCSGVGQIGDMACETCKGDGFDRPEKDNA